MRIDLDDSLNEKGEKEVAMEESPRLMAHRCRHMAAEPLSAAFASLNMEIGYEFKIAGCNSNG
jgi:hypothetical protein